MGMNTFARPQHSVLHLKDEENREVANVFLFHLYAANSSRFLSVSLKTGCATLLSGKFHHGNFVTILSSCGLNQSLSFLQ